MIARRDIVILAGLFACDPSVLFAQTTDKAFRIGVLRIWRSTERSASLETFFAELGRLGYVEGKNIVIDDRPTDRSEKLRELAQDLVQHKVDVIFAPATPAAAAAVAATRSIPIVTIAGNLVEMGYATSLARPGGNVTGVEPPNTIGKQIGTLKQIIPSLARIAMLDLEGHEIHPRMFSEARIAADSIGVVLEDAIVRSEANLEGTFSALSDKRIEAVLVSPHPFFVAIASRVAALSLKRRIASTSFYITGAEAGALLAYDPDINSLNRRAAIYVDKILRGAPAAELPIERATHFIFAINLKTAKALGIVVPPSILALADRVIE